MSVGERMKIRIAGIQKLSMVNGDGCRLVVFVQGCDHHCTGCHNPDTWAFDAGDVWNTEELAAAIRPWIEMHPIDGITFSGGDPVYQADACMDVIKHLPENINVWVYTGFDYELVKNIPLIKRADVVVDGEYIESLRCTDRMCGSANQRIIRKGRT